MGKCVAPISPDDIPSHIDIMHHDPKSSPLADGHHRQQHSHHGHAPEGMPQIRMAIVEPNVLACMGLENTLRKIIPVARIDTFSSYEALMDDDAERFAHFFVAARIYFEHSHFFRRRPFATIVLTNGENLPPTPGLLTLNVCQTEEALIRSLLEFHAFGHGAGPHRPRTTSETHRHPTGTHGEATSSHDTTMHHKTFATTGEPRQPLTLREIEVATQLARGYTNKEVAVHLNISLSTVITHRKNLMAKLGAHSLSDIIIYTVMNGHLDLGV